MTMLNDRINPAEMNEQSQQTFSHPLLEITVVYANRKRVFKIAKVSQCNSGLTF